MMAKQLHAEVCSTIVNSIYVEDAAKHDQPIFRSVKTQGDEQKRKGNIGHVQNCKRRPSQYRIRSVKLLRVETEVCCSGKIFVEQRRLY